jgi:acetyl esterase/lipase
MRTLLVSINFLVAAMAVVLLPGSSRAEAAEPPKLREVFDIRYHDADYHQALDVIGPPDARNAPVVIVVHGGSWMVGDKDFYGRYRGVGRFLAQKGMVAVLINYRLSPAVKHPEHVKDVARAYAWVRHNITKYGGDPDRIFLCGHSAGGHLVALLATDDTYLKDPALKLGEKDRKALRGVIAVSGVYRIPPPAEYDHVAAGVAWLWLRRAGIETDGSPTLGAMVAGAGKGLNPFRRAFGEDPEVCKQASPLTHVHAGLPPFLLINAEHDLPTLPEMAHDFAAALRKAGCAFDVLEAPGRSHNNVLFHLRDRDDVVARAICEFITTYSDSRRP